MLRRFLVMCAATELLWSSRWQMSYSHSIYAQSAGGDLDTHTTYIRRGSRVLGLGSRVHTHWSHTCFLVTEVVQYYMQGLHELKRYKSGLKLKLWTVIST